jgi:hypothetical protein
MDIRAAFQINGEPIFGTFGGSSLENLKIASETNMNLITGGEDVLDPSTDTGRFCLEHGIKVMYYLSGNVHGRPRTVGPIDSVQTQIPIADGIVPSGSKLVQIDDELLSYKEATATALIGCERGIDGSEAADHEASIILFWPELAAEEVARVRESPNLWGYWVLDDSPGYAAPALRGLYSIVKSLDTDHPVCAGHSGPTTLRNFAPGTCDVMAFYLYPILRDRYLRLWNSSAAQWTLTDARARVPGVPFIGVYQGFWEAEDSARLTNTSDALTPDQLREQIEDFVREGACGFLTYSMVGPTGPFRGWHLEESLRDELTNIGRQIRSTEDFGVPPEPDAMAQARIQPQGFYEHPRDIPGIVPAWHIIGPFDASEQGNPLEALFPPDQEIDLDASYPAKGTVATWETYDSYAGSVGLVEIFGAPSFTTGCLAYATCTVRSPCEQSVQMRFGSDEDCIVKFDDIEIWRFEGSRGVIPDEDIVPVILSEGSTQITVKVHNRGDQWGLFMRFTNTQGDGIDNLIFSPQTQ